MLHEILFSALQNFTSNKKRSFVTMFGIIISIASAILIHIIGASLSATIKQSFINPNSSNILSIRLEKEDTTIFIGSSAEQPNFTQDMGLEFEKQYSGSVKTIYKREAESGKFYYQPDKYIDTAVNVCNAELKKLMDSPMVYGRFITDRDVEEKRNTVVISSLMAEYIWKTENPCGKIVSFQHKNGETIQLTICGVYQYEGSSSVNDEFFKGNIYICKSYYEKHFFDKTNPTSYLDFYFSNTEKLRQEAEDFFKRYIKTNGYTVEAYLLSDDVLHIEHIINTMVKLTTIISIISLIVGEIGVMNIMLVSVNERMREIGIKKAIGATNYIIILEFISEAAIIAVIGAFIGILSGLIISFNLVNVVKIICNFGGIDYIQPVFSIPFDIIILAFFLSLIMGILFGILPALKASSLNVIDSIRSE